MDYGLPTSVTIDGQDFPIRYDFRVIMDIFEAINDPDMDNQERGHHAAFSKTARIWECVCWWCSKAYRAGKEAARHE